jgi:hypothetical protein
MLFQTQAFYPLLETAISKNDNLERVSHPHLEIGFLPLLNTIYVAVMLTANQ